MKMFYSITYFLIKNENIQSNNMRLFCLFGMKKNGSSRKTVYFSKSCFSFYSYYTANINRNRRYFRVLFYKHRIS